MGNTGRPKHIIAVGISGVPSKDRSKFLLKACEICSNLKGENSNSTLFESELEVRTLEEQINMIPALRIVFFITYAAPYTSFILDG